MAEHLLLSFECDHQSLNPSVESKASLHGEILIEFMVYSAFMVGDMASSWQMIIESIWLRFDNQGIGDESVQLHYSFISNVIGRHNKLKLPLTSISREELHSRVSLLVLFFFQNKTNTPTQIKTRQIHISCALPLTKRSTTKPTNLVFYHLYSCIPFLLHFLISFSTS